jgi:hypothetical protein
MTVIEQIVDAVEKLDERRQRLVLALVARLREVPDVSLATVDLEDDAAVDAWSERMARRASTHVAEAMAELRALGLIDEQGRIVPRELPTDMQPESKTSVTT